MGAEVEGLESSSTVVPGTLMGGWIQSEAVSVSGTGTTIRVSLLYHGTGLQTHRNKHEKPGLLLASASPYNGHSKVLVHFNLVKLLSCPRLSKNPIKPASLLARISLSKSKETDEQNR